MTSTIHNSESDYFRLAESEGVFIQTQFVYTLSIEQRMKTILSNSNIIIKLGQLNLSKNM